MEQRITLACLRTIQQGSLLLELWCRVRHRLQKKRCPQKRSPQRKNPLTKEPGGEEEIPHRDRRARFGRSPPPESAAEEPTSLGAEEGDLSDVDVLYLVADETIELTTTSSGVVEVTPTSDVRIVVPADAVLADVETVTLTIGEDTYLMRLDDALDLYYADLTIPDVLTLLQVYVLVTYEDGSTDSVSSYLRVVSPGYVYQVVDWEEAVVSSCKGYAL